MPTARPETLILHYSSNLVDILVIKLSNQKLSTTIVFKDKMTYYYFGVEIDMIVEPHNKQRPVSAPVSDHLDYWYERLWVEDMEEESAQSVSFCDNQNPEDPGSIPLEFKPRTARKYGVSGEVGI